MIKSWAELTQRTLAKSIIEWDGVAKSKNVNVPVARNPVLIVLDNKSKSALTATLQQLVTIDDTNASATIGDITITADEAGAQGNEYSVEVVVPESAEATDLVVELTNKVITITLAVDATGTPDDTKNTVELIIAAINAEETGIEGFTASGTGTVISAAVEPVQFTGGTTEVWVDFFSLEETAISISVAAEKTACFGPFQSFPKFLKGRITLSADSAPTDKETTRVIVQEV
jgi:hypothetical protein